MDGILIIDKPDGLTSHDVVARVRRILKAKRVGHTGTLDPFATGVMVLLIGKATRLAQFLDKDEKEYEAIVRFGYETDTGDRTGNRTFESGLNSEEILTLLHRTDLEELLAGFRGEILQVPPMYSAKKVEGKKLYELARKGVEVERDPVRVTIHELELSRPSDFGRNSRTADLPLRVVCSAGTYIRTLAEDMGRRLGIGAHLAELRRTRAGRFTLSQSVTLETLEKAEVPPAYLLPLSEAVAHLPVFTLSGDRVEKTKNGLTSRPDREWPDGTAVRMNAEDGSVIAIGVYKAGEKVVQPKVVLI